MNCDDDHTHVIPVYALALESLPVRVMINC